MSACFLYSALARECNPYSGFHQLSPRDPEVLHSVWTGIEHVTFGTGTFLSSTPSPLHHVFNVPHAMDERQAGCIASLAFRTSHCVPQHCACQPSSSIVRAALCILCVSGAHLVCVSGDPLKVGYRLRVMAYVFGGLCFRCSLQRSC